MKGFRYLERSTLRLEAEVCIGCGKCIEVCPHQVFAMSDRKAQLLDHGACMECGACAKNCPVAAIRVQTGVGCATWFIDDWFGGKKFGKLGGQCGG